MKRSGQAWLVCVFETIPFHGMTASVPSVTLSFGVNAVNKGLPSFHTRERVESKRKVKVQLMLGHRPVIVQSIIMPSLLPW